MGGYFANLYAFMFLLSSGSDIGQSALIYHLQNIDGRCHYIQSFNPHGKYGEWGKLHLSLASASKNCVRDFEGRLELFIIYFLRGSFGTISFIALGNYCACFY